MDILSFNQSSCMTINPQIPVKSLSSRYQIISNLGSGSFGSVSLAKVRNHVLENLLNDMNNFKDTLMEPLSVKFKNQNDLVAIKTMTKKLKKLSDYSKVKEIHFILSVRSHFNLVQVYDIFIDRSSLKLNIVMESMDQNLYQLMKLRKGSIFSPKTLKSILTQLLSAILHIHKHLFFHRDVKPENILVMQSLNFYGSKQNIPHYHKNDAYIIKLADYGLARHIHNQRPFTAYVSTRWYRSPEILLRQPYYSFPVDIWALGCVAVECATFCPLFPGSNELDQTCKVLDFLGCPQEQLFKSNIETSNLVPFGGFWSDALKLADNLGLTFPKTLGYNLDDIITRKDFTQLERLNFFNVIRSCLTWDPERRATAYSLCHMNYFKSTILEQENQKENFMLSSTSTPTSMLKSKFRTKSQYSYNNYDDTEPIVFSSSPNAYSNINSSKISLNSPSKINLQNSALNSSKMQKSQFPAGISDKENLKSANSKKNNPSAPENKNIQSFPSTKMEEPSNRSIDLAEMNDAKNKNDENNNSVYRFHHHKLNRVISNLNPGLGFVKSIDFGKHKISSKILSYNEIKSNGEISKSESQLEKEIEEEIKLLEAQNKGGVNVDELYNFRKAINYEENSNCIDAEYEEGEEEEYDNVSDDDDADEDLISLEISKTYNFLHDPNTQTKPLDSNIFIKSGSAEDHDLINAISYALDDELN